MNAVFMSLTPAHKPLRSFNHQQVDVRAAALNSKEFRTQMRIPSFGKSGYDAQAMHTTLEEHKSAEKEKASVAAKSALAAIGLTVFKIIVGLSTGSLGILAEAAHSGLDLVAALVTYFAVRFAGRPPDLDHTYGHGKVENLSALVETLLLLATCVWIISQAVQRLRSGSMEVDPSFWGFAVMCISIVIDYGRSRSLMRAAKKHRSQALEVDALHFSTDIWSSLVVIFGLLCVWFGDRHPTLRFLERADSLAALGVSAIVIYVSFRLGRQTVDALLDRVRPDVSLTVQSEAAKVTGVSKVSRVRVREVGGQYFIEIQIELDRKKAFERAAEISAQIEKQLQMLYPGADVTVHAKPITAGVESSIEKVQVSAARLDMKVHNVVVFESGGKQHVNYHLEVPDDSLLRDVWVLAQQLETSIRRELPNAESINVHFDPRSFVVDNLGTAALDMRAAIQKVRDVLLAHPEIDNVHDLIVHHIGARQKDGSSVIDISCHCTLSQDMLVRRIHELDDILQNEMRELIPTLRYLFIQPEPPYTK